MSEREDSNGGPQFTATVHSSEDEVLADRWAGSTLGKFRIIRQLGRGGMGVVYEAHDPILQRAVAIKVLRDGIAARPQAVRKFLREARTAAKLNNPHVVAVHDAGQEKEIVFLVMELMEGGSAHDRIAKWGPFHWVEASQVMADACRGLAAVHSAGLIHRDIKPSNIMRAADGMVKLADFGLALTVAGSSDSSTHHGHVVGTPMYMSPEQCRARKIDPRSDIYAMGATYYTLLTGLPPFDGKNSMDVMYGHCSGSIPDPCAVVQGIPAACAELIRRTMAKEPNHRPADADALLEDLQAIVDLATSPDIELLDWSANADNRIAPTPLPHALSTVMEPITPLYVSAHKPQTRFWFVAICLLLMGAAFGVGHYLSRPDDKPSTAALDQQPDDSKQTPNDSKDRRDRKEGAVQLIDAGGPVTSLAFDPVDAMTLSWGRANGVPNIFDLNLKRDRLGEALTDRKLSNACQVAYSPNREGRFWAALAGDRVYFFGVDKARIEPFKTPLLTAPGKKILAFAIHPGGKIAALAVRDAAGKGEIAFRGVGDSQLLTDAKTEAGQPPALMAFSSDGKLLLTGRENGLFNVWDVDVGKKDANGAVSCLVKSGPTFPIGSGAPSAAVGVDAKRFAVAFDSQVWLCEGRDTADGKTMLFADRESGKKISLLTALPSKNKLVWASGKSVFLFDVVANRIVHEFTEHASPVKAIACDASGKHLASGDENGKIVIRTLLIE